MKAVFYFQSYSPEGSVEDEFLPDRIKQCIEGHPTLSFVIEGDVHVAEDGTECELCGMELVEEERDGGMCRDCYKGRS